MLGGKITETPFLKVQSGKIIVWGLILAQSILNKDIVVKYESLGF